jgi:hypothetical protein
VGRILGTFWEAKSEKRWNINSRNKCTSSWPTPERLPLYLWLDRLLILRCWKVTNFKNKKRQINCFTWTHFFNTV